MQKNRTFIQNVMPLLTLTAILFGIGAISLPARAEVANKAIMYLFWGKGCPHCEKERTFLAEFHKKYPALEIRAFETWENKDASKFAEAMRQVYGLEGSGVPLTFVGEWNTTGFDSADQMGVEIEKQVVACLEKGCVDPIDKLIPRSIVAKVKAEAAQGAPVGWELFPATAQ